MMDVKVPNITIYTLWTCDAWIATKSFSLIGIFSTKEKAIDVAKEKALLQKDTYVVIYSGELDNYDDTEQKIFSTEFSQDKAQLKKQKLNNQNYSTND